MEDWKKELEEKEWSDSSSEETKVKTVRRPLLFIAAVVILIMNFVIFEQKRPGYLTAKLDPYYASIRAKISPNDEKISIQPATKTDKEDPLVSVLKGLMARVGALEDKDYTTDEEKEKLQKEINELDKKIFLLVIVSDENAAMSKQSLNREFMHIDADWNINRMPTHISIGPEAEEFLRKRLR